MAKPGELEAALRKADAAGDVEGARRLARAIRKERQMAAPAIEAKPTDQTPGQPKVAFTTGLDTEIDPNRGMPDIVGQSREYVDRGGRSGELFRRGVQKLSDPGQNSAADWTGLIDLAGSGVRAAYDFYGDPEKSVDDKIAGTMEGLGEFSGRNAQARVHAFETGIEPTGTMKRIGIDIPEGYDPSVDRATATLSAMFAGSRGQIGSGKFRGRTPGLPQTPVKDAALDAVSNLTGGASDLAILASKPVGGAVGAGVGAAKRLMPPGSPRLATPPAGPPAVIPPAAGGGASGPPPPGTMTPVGPPRGRGGAATGAFNAMDPKTREAVLRLLENSGVQRNDIGAIVRDLDSLPAERRSMYGPEIVRRYGAKYPELEANIAAVGREFAVSTPKPRQFMGVTLERDAARQTMNDEVRRQIDSEGAFVTGTAERQFGPGVVPANKALEDELDFLSGEYEKLLSTKRSPTGRLRSQAKKDAVMQARDDLTSHLRDPALMRTMPDWVKKQVMLQASEDMRRLKFTPDELGVILAGDGKVLAPLFEPNAPLEWSPQLWDHLARQYPTQAAHSLQSAYRQAADTAFTRGDPQSIADARMLTRLRGGEGEGGVLDQLERAVPNYRDLRLNFGDRKSAQRAIELLEDFKTAAKKEGDTAEIIRDIAGLPGRHREMAENQITSIVRQAIKDKVENPKLSELDRGGGTVTPNLTQLSKQPFLDALPKVFGPKGQELADAIRWAKSNTDYLTGIHPKYNSRSITNLEDVKNARNLYEDPAGADTTILDRVAQTAGTLGVGAAFIPGGQTAAIGMLSLAGAKALWNAHKAGKRLSPKQRTQLAEFLFKSREANPDASSAARIPGPRGPSPIGYAGNVAVGAGVGAGTAAATGQDPITGAAIGAGAGGARAAGRAFRAGRSVIPTGGAPPQLGPPSRPPGKPEKMGFGNEIAAGSIGATIGANTDFDGDGTISMEERVLGGLGGAAGAAGIARGLRRIPTARTDANQMTFGGVNAKTADKKLLGIAQQMEKSGASRDQIWKETGWFKGVEGKWKFEIPDNEAQLRELTPFDQLRESAGIPRTLDRVMTDPDAGGAYPKLRGMPAFVSEAGPGPSSPRGEFNPRNGGKIRVYEAPANEQRSTLLHERQHAIQRQEDFARGGRGYGTADVEDHAKALYDSERSVDQSLPPWDNASDDIKDIARSKAAHEIYLLQAGEVEARTVQKRADYSPEQRKARPPWHDYDRPEDQQLINFGSGKAESRGPSGGPPKPPGGRTVSGGDSFELLNSTRINPSSAELKAMEKRYGLVRMVKDQDGRILAWDGNNFVHEDAIKAFELDPKSTLIGEYQGGAMGQWRERVASPKPPTGRGGERPAPPPKPGQGGKGPPPPIAERGPPRSVKPPVSKTEQAAVDEVKRARSAYNRAANKYVMKDDRERIVKPLEDRMIAAEQRLATVQANEAKLKTVKARAGEIGASVNRSVIKPAAVGAGLALGTIAGVAGVKALGPPKTYPEPSNPNAPGYDWDLIKADRQKLFDVQYELQNQWGYEVEPDGKWGKQTADAVKHWRWRKGLDPDGPMTKRDLAILKAGPKAALTDEGVPMPALEPAQ